MSFSRQIGSNGVTIVQAAKYPEAALKSLYQLAKLYSQLELDFSSFLINRH